LGWVGGEQDRPNHMLQQTPAAFLLSQSSLSLGADGAAERGGRRRSVNGERRL
jgi:hypothetical protein